MSIIKQLILGLQGFGLMRTRGSELFEKALGNYLNLSNDLLCTELTYLDRRIILCSSLTGKANSVKEIRDGAVAYPEMASELKISLEQATELLKIQMTRLSLKDQNFSTFEPASDNQLEQMWQNCLLVDETLKVNA